MRLALASVCPGDGEGRWLQRVFPTWETYARRHGLDFHVIRRHPRPDAPYWGKYFVLDQPELAGCDAALVIDNDVVIGSAAPLPSESWDGRHVRIADERAQFPHRPDRFARYYEEFALSPPGQPFLVLNTGVMLYTREHCAWFKEVFEAWRDWRTTFRQSPGNGQGATQISHDLSTHDQPHVSRALQMTQRFEKLDTRFNRLWWSWWEDGGRRPDLPLQIYAKGIETLQRGLPAGLVQPLAAPGRHWWARALSDAHFIHVAGAKSPLAIFSPQAGPAEGRRP